jgi:hypothetical protein
MCAGGQLLVAQQDLAVNFQLSTKYFHIGISVNNVWDFQLGRSSAKAGGLTSRKSARTLFDGMARTTMVRLAQKTKLALSSGQRSAASRQITQ